MLTGINAQGIAQTVADDVNRRNSKPGVTEADTSVTVACADGGRAIQVSVQNRHPVKTQLAGIIGIDQISTGSYAVARYIRVSSADGLRPWAICDGTVTAAQAQPTVTFATGLDNKLGLCSSQSSGNWGSVDFNGGGNGAGDLADWTLDGYPDPVVIPGPLPADPGVSNSSALRAAFASLVGQIVLFPSVSGYNVGGGNTGSFAAVGVASVEVCGVLYGNDTINTLPQRLGQRLLASILARPRPPRRPPRAGRLLGPPRPPATVATGPPRSLSPTRSSTAPCP